MRLPLRVCRTNRRVPRGTVPPMRCLPLGGVLAGGGAAGGWDPGRRFARRGAGPDPATPA
ncbi:hypothetical protein PSMK_02280 [Phycisphaera mikurensis NBRC 102666]|uniref:Uncharacterized protein n=1 Tax=Phycisphaera mikurensis (strain NBRC 102666 / KCTC 22515 / FYK2301M01) TaxID=1142394 RepID=I0IAU9_PHYMF|nr:hypothetical protein PSMK_02280 [Phycisphaera mikurensis NBRC 102666]